MRRLSLSFRPLSKKRRTVCAALLFAAVCASVGSVFLLGRGVTPRVEERIQNAADCTQLLLSRGIAVNEPPLAVERIVLPAENGGGYEDYLRLQDKQGLSLREYAGEEATLYLYEDAMGQGLITLIVPVRDGKLAAASRTDFSPQPESMPLF